MKLRDYQVRAAAAVRAAWADGKRAVCLVAPTGAGKTELGVELVGDDGPTLWVAHRTELVEQAETRLRARFGAGNVGLIMPGAERRPLARIQVGTVQTLLARGLPSAELLVLDEAHHYAAEEWRLLAQKYRLQRTLGLTATPERRDGTPLGDIFDHLVVAANYSELVRGGYIVSATVLQPPMNLGNDLAQDPVEAWAKHSGGARTFAFFGRVDLAFSYAARFRSFGIMADTVEAETSPRERRRILDAFRSGKLRVVTNVYALTEGVDVPSATVALLARKFGHVGAYLQAVGRVLRPAPGKDRAIVIDLCGSTLRHGSPTDNRAYALTGRAISGDAFGGGGDGPGEFKQEVRGVELTEANVARRVAAPAEVELRPIDEAERRTEYQRLLGLARANRMRDGFAAVKYREKYGEEPRREWA